jgi:hypothetical protein
LDIWTNSSKDSSNKEKNGQWNVFSYYIKPIIT